MAVESSWKHEYKILKDYITSNPEIHISPSEISVPENARDGFYSRFDCVRRALVKIRRGSLPFDADALAKNYTESENRIYQAANRRVEIPLELSSFLHDPEEGMMRLIYNRLFELIQGKISEDDFERMAAGDLVKDATRLFRLGYAVWAALAIVLRLEPDELFGVAIDGNGAPCTTEIDEICFGRQFHHPAKRVPEFLFHSKKLGSYVAFKMPLAREINAYKVPEELPVQRLLRNRNGDSSSTLDFRMTFLSVVRDLKRIPVFADLYKRNVAGPDLAIVYLMERDFSDSEAIEEARNRVEILKPRLGGCAVIMDPSSKSESFDIGGNISAFSVGLDPSGFEHVIDKLI